MDQPRGVSVVIPNYNYSRFVGHAIESALAQDHPETEVIVVDNGSTDDSPAVIERYRDRVRAVFLPVNGGPVAAMNAGWPLARHDIVIFLDSDDMLAPDAASAVARAWTPGTAKVQFPMFSIDADGRYLGHVSPKFMPGVDTEAIKRELLETGSCPAAWGSGNAYAKWLIEQAEPPIGTMVLDTLLEVNAPFLGTVTTLSEPLAYYRMHGSNDTQQGNISADRFINALRRFDDKVSYFKAQTERWGFEFDPEAAKRRSIYYLEQRMALSRLLPSGDPRRTPPASVFGDAVRAVARSPVDARRKAFLLAWFSAVAFAPAPVARRLIAVRFVIATRPRWLESVIGADYQVAETARGAAAGAPAEAPKRSARLKGGAAFERGAVAASSANER